MNRHEKNLILIILTFIFTCLLLNKVFANPVNIPLRNKINDASSGIELKGGVKIDYERQVVTLNLKNSDLRQVLRMLADKSGKNIIMDDSVKGTISLDLVDVDINKAFEYIMTINNLTYWEDGNTLVIADNDAAVKKGLNMSEIKAIAIKYVDAQKIANFLNKNVFSINRPNTSTSSIVTSNPGTNEILIFGSSDDIKLAQKVIKYLDVKPQVKSFEVNFADPETLATKICWTVFKSKDGEDDISKSADQEEGSKITKVCGDTSKPEVTSDNKVLDDLDTSSYWVLDTGLNQITIYGGTPEQLNMAAEIIKNFDKREPQVYLEISIIELNESGSKILSNAWTHTSGTDTFSFSNGSTILSHFMGSQDNIATIRDNLSVNSIANRTLVSTINMLVAEQKGRVLANPRIIAANNTQSVVDISSDYISKTTQTIDADTNETTTDYTLASDNGIQFSILPKITPNGYVYLTLEPTFNSIKEQITGADGGIVATLLNKRSLNTKNVRVKDGDTLVIGGLIQENETTSHKKIPILADIPIIGTFFQDQSTIKSRSELIFMITPRILKDPDQVGTQIKAQTESI